MSVKQKTLMFPFSKPNETPGDPRVRKLLDQLEIKYEFRKEVFHCIFVDSAEDDKGTVICCICSQTHFVAGHEIREMTSPLFREGKPWTLEDLPYFLIRNRTLKIGAWAMAQTSPANTDMIPVFVLNFSGEADAEILGHMMRSVISEVGDAQKHFSQPGSPMTL